MATQETTAAENAGPTPVACTLTSANLAAQSERWQQLASRAMTERVETEHGLRICFRTEDGVDGELRELVAAENECCAWASWTVESGAQQTVVEVRSTGEGVTTLHSMFTSLKTAPTAHGG